MKISDNIAASLFFWFVAVALSLSAICAWASKDQGSAAVLAWFGGLFSGLGLMRLVLAIWLAEEDQS